jgi:hypothetical protein
MNYYIVWTISQLNVKRRGGVVFILAQDIVLVRYILHLSMSHFSLKKQIVLLESYTLLVYLFIK